MDRRGLLRGSLQAAGATVLSRYTSSGSRSAETATPTKPNVIWILGDQHRSFAIGCNGDPNVRTPNMDILFRYRREL